MSKANATKHGIINTTTDTSAVAALKLLNEEVFKIEIETLQKKLIDARLLVLEVFTQSCTHESDYGKYDHMCLSAYEEAQQSLIEWGLIKKEECSRR